MKQVIYNVLICSTIIFNREAREGGHGGAREPWRDDAQAPPLINRSRVLMELMGVTYHFGERDLFGSRELARVRPRRSECAFKYHQQFNLASKVIKIPRK